MFFSVNVNLPMLSVLLFGRMREKSKHGKLHGRKNKFRSQYGGVVDDIVVILYNLWHVYKAYMRDTFSMLFDIC